MNFISLLLLDRRVGSLQDYDVAELDQRVHRFNLDSLANPCDLHADR